MYYSAFYFEISKEPSCSFVRPLLGCCSTPEAILSTTQRENEDQYVS